ncbi:putative Averantin oxidoreductase [Cryomyces antarcticus]
MQNLLLNFIPKEVRQRRRNHLNFSREKVLRRLENTNTHHKDFIWYILKQREKHDLKQDEIVVNSALFIVAGSETTANLLSGLIARLFYNKPKYDKLVHEIRSSFKTEDELTYENLSKLSYLNACLEEGLRIHPPTSVAVSSWAAAHNPVNFRDCDSFKAMQPFSLGPRGCIGRHLSYLEMRLILGRLLWNFDLVSTDNAWQWDPADEMKNRRAFMTWEKPDLNIKV